MSIIKSQLDTRSEEFNDNKGLMADLLG